MRFGKLFCKDKKRKNFLPNYHYPKKKSFLSAILLQPCVREQLHKEITKRSIGVRCCYMMDSLAEQWLGASKTPSKPLSNSPKMANSNKKAISHEQVRKLANQPLQQIMAPMVRAQVTHYMSMNLAIFCTETKPEFITSDAPLVWYDPDSAKRPPLYRAPGLIYDTIEVTLPISPKQLIFISWKDNLEGYIDIKNEIAINRLNLRTWYYCDEFFIVSENTKKDFWLGKTTTADDTPS